MSTDKKKWEEAAECIRNNDHCKIRSIPLYSIINNDYDEHINYTLLRMACDNEREEIVKYLLTIPNIDVNKMTPLINCKKLEIVKMLLGHEKINVNQTNENNTPLYRACLEGDVEIVKLLLQSPYIDVNKFNPLKIACKNSDTEIVKLLVNVPSIKIDKSIAEEIVQDVENNAQKEMDIDTLILKYSRHVEIIQMLNGSIEIQNKIDRLYLESIQYLLVRMMFIGSDCCKISDNGELIVTSSNEQVRNLISSYMEYSSAFELLLSSPHKKPLMTLPLRHVLSHKKGQYLSWEEYVVYNLAEMIASSYPCIQFKPRTSQQISNPNIEKDKKKPILLGSGGYGFVYKVKLDGKEVAEKVIHSISGIEIEILEKINTYTGTVEMLYHSFNEEGVRIYFELMDSSLKEYIFPGENSFLKLFQILTVCLKCSDTLNRMHQDGIVHNDIKPENILVSRMKVGSEILVKDAKIADFDVSQQIEKTHTFNVSIAGTQSYMAPELIALINNQLPKDFEFNRKALDVSSLELHYMSCYLEKPIRKVVLLNNLSCHSSVSVDSLETLLVMRHLEEILENYRIFIIVLTRSKLRI